MSSRSRSYIILSSEAKWNIANPSAIDVAMAYLDIISREDVNPMLGELTWSTTNKPLANRYKRPMRPHCLTVN